jgi:hypothetical protein
MVKLKAWLLAPGNFRPIFGLGRPSPDKAFSSEVDTGSREENA